MQISVYEDKIIFWNAGRLPDELSIELLQKKHPSIPYNPLVASAFFRAGYIETWGRGIEKINNECKKAGVSLPDIDYEFAGLMVTFRAEIEEKVEETRVKTTRKTSGKTSGKILELMKFNREITIPEMALEIGVTERSIERNIQNLQKKGIIQRIGPAKGGYWEIIKE